MPLMLSLSTRANGIKLRLGDFVRAVRGGGFS
jgi:hypothetical protein